VVAPRGVVEKTVQKGIAPKAEVAVVFQGAFQYEDANKLALRTMVLLLQSRLSDAIRSELGGTYSITADAVTTKVPKPEYRVRIGWSCDPARAESLVQRVLAEIDSLKATLLTPDQVARVRAVLLREFEQDSQENGYLLGQLARRYEDGEADAAGVNPPVAIAALDGQAIQRAAQTYLDMENYVKVMLVPETK
jgi:zinc protease